MIVGCVMTPMNEPGATITATECVESVERFYVGAQRRVSFLDPLLNRLSDIATEIEMHDLMG